MSPWIVPQMLTEKQIRALKPTEKEYEVSDGRSAKAEGILMLRVRPNGAKEFFYRRRVNGKKPKVKLGKIGLLWGWLRRGICAG